MGVPVKPMYEAFGRASRMWRGGARGGGRGAPGGRRLSGSPSPVHVLPAPHRTPSSGSYRGRRLWFCSTTVNWLTGRQSLVGGASRRGDAPARVLGRIGREVRLQSCEGVPQAALEYDLRVSVALGCRFAG